MRIRVDTDDLQAKSKSFQSAADAFGQAGDDILNTALSLPSYDGQLSGPARAAAYEIQRQSREVQAGLTGDAQLADATQAACQAYANSLDVENFKKPGKLKSMTRWTLPTKYSER